jgi:hypothetical protein
MYSALQRSLLKDWTALSLDGVVPGIWEWKSVMQWVPGRAPVAIEAQLGGVMVG